MTKLDTSGLRKSLQILGVEAVAYLTRVLTEKDKRATGSLIRSLDFTIVREMDSLMLGIIANDYLTFIDKGRRPGKRPPIKPILSWIKAKPIKISNMTERQAAFVIARSIGKKGIKPTNIMDGLVRNILSKKDALIRQGVKEDIERYISETFIKEIKT